MTKRVSVNWEPQPRQLTCLKACGLDFPFTGNKPKKAVADIIGYGGAAGGGKTDTMVGGALVAALAYPGINIGAFRRKFPQLQGLGGFIERSKQIIPKELAIYHETKHRWTFINGSKIDFCHCQNPPDVQNYQSQQFDILMLDETTQFEEGMVKFLLTRNRATVKHDTFAPFSLFATNPGNIGHAYFKKEFVDIGEPEKVQEFINETGVKESHIFIPAKLKDNVILEERDPGYRDRLSPNEKIRRILLEGDWDVFEGQVFDEFRREKHVVSPVIPKFKFPHFLWIDWGYSGREADQGAFAALSGALVKTKFEDQVFNRVIVYKEWYGKKKNPDEWADIIYKSRSVPKFRECVADSSMFNPQSDGSTPIIKLMGTRWRELNGGRSWVTYKRGTKNRIGRVATLHNWLSIAPDGLPYMLITESCQHLVRTIPLMIYDEYNVEDVDTQGEDHLYDALTYGLSAIRFIPSTIGGVSPRTPEKKVLPEIIDKLDLREFEKKSIVNKDWRAV